jgi:hypothetical protein
MPRLHVRSCIATSLFLIAVAVAADSKPNLSGTWKMNAQKSDAGSEIKSRIDTIEHQDPKLKITTVQDDENGKNTVVREYVTDGRQMSQAVLDTDRKSSAHWDGGVLVIETNVNDGAYTIRDRWILADDKRSIQIDRQFSSSQGTRTQRVVLEKE